MCCGRGIMITSVVITIVEVNNGHSYIFVRSTREWNLRRFMDRIPMFENKVECLGG